MTKVNVSSNRTHEDFLTYKIGLLTKVMYIGIFFSLLTVIMGTLDIKPYPWNPIQITTNFLYVTITTGLVLFLRKNKHH